MKKALSNLVTIATIAVMVWVGASYIDIVRQNSQPNPQYTSWNAIVMFIDSAMEYHNM